jgi:site-specific DNA-cytosine methylase
MGFDSPARATFEIPVSDTQAYKQFGNAVVVPVIEAIAEYMLPHILNDKPLLAARNEKREKRYRQLALF